MGKKRNWRTLDDRFPWDMNQIEKDVGTVLREEIDVSIIFCDAVQANRIAVDSGFEEEEIPWYAAALYWKEMNTIFIFQYEHYRDMLEIVFHELRHAMQYKDPNFRQHFETDKRLPYEKRVTEKDAVAFAKRCIEQYQSKHE